MPEHHLLGGVFGDLVGISPEMQDVYQQIRHISQWNFPVLILGETGTGKELVARSIHFAGPNRNGPFVPVDCTAIPAELAESELFGHVKGSFTGADRSRRGLMECANGGTLFLDEIGDLNTALQAKLLRAIQEKEVRPVGGTQCVPLRLRIVAATNRDLASDVRQGSFRQDLFFRLNVLQITLPPLRDRKQDIPILVNHLINKYRTSDARSGEISISEECLSCLLAYHWPGNVRELSNAIEHAVALRSGSRIEPCDLPGYVRPDDYENLPREDVVRTMAEVERNAILRAIEHSHGDILKAARQLGIGKTTIYRKLKVYGTRTPRSGLRDATP